MRTEDLAIMRTDDLAIERYARQPLPTLRVISSLCCFASAGQCWLYLSL
jgi:hypothetical protein